MFHQCSVDLISACTVLVVQNTNAEMVVFSINTCRCLSLRRKRGDVQFELLGIFLLFLIDFFSSHILIRCDTLIAYEQLATELEQMLPPSGQAGVKRQHK